MHFHSYPFSMNDFLTEKAYGQSLETVIFSSKILSICIFSSFFFLYR